MWFVGQPIYSHANLGLKSHNAWHLDCCGHYCRVPLDTAPYKDLESNGTTSTVYKTALSRKVCAFIRPVRHGHLQLAVSRKTAIQLAFLVRTSQNRFPVASSWGSKSCLEQRVNSRQEAIKVSFIHSHYCFYVFAIMFIDMFERSTSCSSVQLPVKMGHLSRNKPHSF